MPGLLTSIYQDIQVVFERDPAATSTLEILLAYPGFHARQLHRIAHFLWRMRVPLVPRLISHYNRSVTGIEIHPGARLGERLFIDHGMGIVIGETSEIGDDCSLYQGVTLGGTSTQHTKRHPTLGNNVVVGAGAKLIGAIHVGDGVKIGAGSVVVTSVPSHATVVGVPGRVVAIRNPDEDTTERLPDPEWDLMQALQNRITELEARLAALEARPAAEETPPQAGSADESGALGRRQ